MVRWGRDAKVVDRADGGGGGVGRVRGPRHHGRPRCLDLAAHGRRYPRWHWRIARRRYARLRRRRVERLGGWGRGRHRRSRAQGQGDRGWSWQPRSCDWPTHRVLRRSRPERARAEIRRNKIVGGDGTIVGPGAPNGYDSIGVFGQGNVMLVLEENRILGWSAPNPLVPTRFAVGVVSCP